MSAITSLLNRLYPRQTEYTVTMLGTGWAGKTTILYFLKLGEIVNAIPTFGFNVETIDAPTTSGKPFRLVFWDVGTGCSSTMILSTLVTAYTENSDAIVWVVDAVDRELLKESVDTLRSVLTNIDTGRERDAKWSPFPILLLVNKRDLPNPIPMPEVMQAFAKVLSGRPSCIFPTSIKQGSVDKSGLPEAFEWLRFALENAARGKMTAGNPTQSENKVMPNFRNQSVLSEKLDSWVSRAQSDSNPEVFIDQFKTLSLPAWDHYTHIRLAFLLLTIHGRQKGKDMIFSGISNYISNSPNARGRTFHVTMTYFWIQIVHLGIRNISPSTDLVSSASTALPSNMAHIASPDQFALFLALNPYVADGELWKDYYSKDLMMGPEAKNRMVLPDKKPLPNLVARDAIGVPGAAK